MDKPASASQPAADTPRPEIRDLDAIMAPRTVAVIGATEMQGIGRIVLSNLVNHPFGGTVYPIHPHEKSVLGIQAYPLIAAVPERIDLAVIASPARTVPGIIGECADAGVRGAIILSAGFRETGPAGAALEQDILAQARRGSIRMIGPNCLGVINTAVGLDATFAKQMPRRGHLAFVSQSGALGAAVLDWSLRENVGISTFASVGSMLDVDWSELIFYLADDPQTRSILLYMETIGDAHSFLSAAREVALAKPIIILKAGRTEGAAHAAASHTGALSGSDAVLDAAVRRVGALRVDSLADLFYMAEVLEKQPRPVGPRLTIITNAGGPAVVAADALVAHGGELASLSANTLRALDGLLPENWSHTNPIDLLDDAAPERYAEAVRIAGQDPNTDGLLVILAPEPCSNPTKTAQQITTAGPRVGKPLLASWMGAGLVDQGEDILNRARIPTFGYPDTAARMFDYMWRYTYNLRGIYETPTLPPRGEGGPDRTRADGIISTARAAGRTLLSEFESKQLLAAYALPVVDTRLAIGVEQAVACALEIGFPVVLKIHSQTLTHKVEAGGVQLNLGSVEQVRRAYLDIQAHGGEHFQGVTVQPMIEGEGYELIVGSSVDPQFGPVLLFGLGGDLTEVFEDRALALPPLNTTLARRMLEQTRIFPALRGGSGRAPIALGQLEQLLVRFSQLVSEERWIQEVDINPLFVPLEDSGRERGMMALDARIILFPPNTREQELPRLAISPYPAQYVSEWTSRQGMPVTIRPIRPEDEPLVAKFHETLSDRSVFLRYMHLISLSQRVAHERLARVCFNDYDRELALVVEHTPPETGAHEIIAVGRLTKLRRRNEAEFAILVSDQYQGHGLGTELLRRLVEIGRDQKVDRVIGYIASENTAMLRVAQRLGFRLRRTGEDTEVEAVIEL